MSTESTANKVAIVENPEYLAGKINACHREVIHHGKSMLAHAAEAGRGLIAVKGMLQHGEFGKWVEKNCVFSYRVARQYMQVAKNGTIVPFSDDRVVSIFEALHGEKEGARKAPHPTPTDLSQDDASHALKLHALVERGATEGERDVARRKLEAFAKGFGHTADALVSEAQGVLPDWQKSPEQIELDRYNAEAQAAKAEAATLRAQLEAIQGRISELDAEYDKLSREELKSVCIGLVLEREGLTKIIKEAA